MKTSARKITALAVALVAAATWGTNSFAQAQLPRLGILAITGEESSRIYDANVYKKLTSLGWVEGKNVELVFSSANQDPSRYPQAVAELVRQRVDVIYADSAPAVRAAHAATRTIPIVCSDYTTDPVAEGYAKSYGRPGGNVTGVFLDAPAFSGKLIELLKSLVPNLTQAVVLWDPSPGDTHVRAFKKIAPSFGVQLQIVEVHTPEDIDTAPSLFQRTPQALFIVPSPMMYFESARLARLAVKQKLPATSMAQQFAVHGGLVAYGPEQNSANEQVAILIGKILGGAKPAELPIERPTRYELVVNVKAAKALGLTIPDAIMAQADRIIR
ncbi:MAG: ABC transporter substrate-binding protein [Rubricoccaceae bacterium]|nr:ABC transporter substrate-binding protein [Rubricoccaceae bacterium]